MAEQAGTPAPAPAAGKSGTPAPAQAPAAGGGSPPPAAAGDWTAGLSETTRGFVQTRGFKDPGQLAESYVNLEKLMGVPKDRLLKLPENDADVEGFNQVYNRLGRPEKPDNYKIPMPEKGGDPKLAEFAKTMFHEAGLTQKQAEKVGAKWNEYNAGIAKTNGEAHLAKVQQEEGALKSEWGAAFEQNIEIGRRAAQKFGVDGATIDKLEAVMGFAGVIKLFHQLGSGTGVSHEGSFVGANNGSGGFGNVLTPAQAKYQIEARRQDGDFVRRYTSGDLAAKEEMSRLHSMAYPEQEN